MDEHNLLERPTITGGRFLRHLLTAAFLLGLPCLTISVPHNEPGQCNAC